MDLRRNSFEVVFPSLTRIGLEEGADDWGELRYGKIPKNYPLNFGKLIDIIVIVVVPTTAESGGRFSRSKTRGLFKAYVRKKGKLSTRISPRSSLFHATADWHGE